jgi:hypothetical protein
VYQRIVFMTPDCLHISLSDMLAVRNASVLDNAFRAVVAASAYRSFAASEIVRQAIALFEPALILASSVPDHLVVATDTARCAKTTKESAMFGRMTVEPVGQVNHNSDLETAVAVLLTATDKVEIVRWIEFQRSVLLFVLVPGDPKSGALYVLDRKRGTWYTVDFDDEQYGGYDTAQFQVLLEECKFLCLIERPELLRTGLQWVVSSGNPPEARA